MTRLSEVIRLGKAGGGRGQREGRQREGEVGWGRRMLKDSEELQILGKRDLKDGEE